MLDAIIQFVFPRFPVTFRSDYSLAASIERFQQVLDGYTPRAYLSFDPLVGEVTGQTVQFHQNGWGSKGFSPMAFSGEFRQTDTGVVLTGHFTLRLSNRLCLGGIFAFLVVGIVGSSMQAASGAHTSWWGPVSGLGFIFFLILNTRCGQQYGNNNRQQLSQIITRLLTRPEPNHALQRTAGAGPSFWSRLFSRRR